VVSIPAIISSTIVPTMWSGSSFCPSISASRRNVVRSSRGCARVLLDPGVDVQADLVALLQRATVLLAQVHLLDHLVDEAAEDVGVLLREAEHLDDHPDRDVLRVVDRGVELRRAGGGVEQVAAQRACEGLERGDPLG
jgi:hypothetical protein